MVTKSKMPIINRILKLYWLNLNYDISKNGDLSLNNEMLLKVKVKY